MPGLERTLEMTILIRAINQTTGAFGGVKLAAVAALGATAAALAYSVKQAAAFQQGLTTLATGAGEAANKLQQVGNGIKQVSINTGETTDDLIKSMFLIESAGIRGATGVQTLQTAAEGALVGNTDLASTTQVLLTTLHDYHQPASQAVADTNEIIATVQHGTMTMDDLNGAMKNVLSIASAFHIKLADVEGALATMSVAGDKGSAAGTHLAMMLRMLSNPATAAADEMAAMGLNSINVANEMRISLPLALQEIETAVREHFTPGSVEFNRAITTILGGTRSGVAGLELMNQNLPIFRTNAENAAKAAASAGNNVNGWSLVQKDFNQQLAETQAALNVMAINIGTQLLPIVEQLLQWVRNTGIPILTDLGNRMIGFIGWAQQGSAGALALKDAMILLAGAVALVKLAGLVTAMRDFVVAVPGMVSNLFLVGNAASGVEVAETAAARAADALTAAQARLGAQAELTSLQVNSASAAMTSSAVQSQAAMIAAGTLPAAAASPEAQALAASQAAAAGKVAAAETEVAAKQAAVEAATATAGALTLGGIITAVGGVAFIEVMVAKYLHDSGVTQDLPKAPPGYRYDGNHQLVQDVAAQTKIAADAAKELADNIKRAWSDMEGMGDYLTAHQHMIDNTLVAPLLRVKSAKDDLAKPWVLPTDIPQHNLNELNVKAMLLKSNLTALGDPITIAVSIGLRSISPLVLKAMQLKDSQDNASYSNTPIPPLVNSEPLHISGYTPLGGYRGQAHAAGLMNSPYGHFAMVGERGPELMYVPKGSNIYPNGTGPGGGGTINVFVSTMAGSRSEVMRMVDMIEQELAHRFRSQTPSFALPGLT